MAMQNFQKVSVRTKLNNDIEFSKSDLTRTSAQQIDLKEK